ncbi:MAG: ABC transporter permease, partial [Dehalococcoidales bacterium]|nr:ABC transporter permease [Dehalococcoidales bacterium]
MKHLHNIGLLTVKDLKLFAADRMALIFALLFPMVFVVLFNFVMTGVNSSDERLVLRLATRESPGSLSYQVIAALETKDKAALKPGEPDIVWLTDYQQAKRDVGNQKISGFIAFPENFTEAVMMGYGTELEVNINPSNTQSAAALKALAQSISAEIGAKQVVNNAVIGLAVENSLASPAAAANLSATIQSVLAGQTGGPTPTPLITVATNTVGDIVAENPANFVIPGYLVMFVFFTAAFSAVQIVKERQNHTMERILTGSATRNEILGGVFAGTVVKGLIQITIFWAVGIFIYKMDLGIAPLAVFLLSILTIFMASAFGLMLAKLVKIERSASSIRVLAS